MSAPNPDNRKKRSELKKFVNEQNSMGSRLIWIRDKLKLKLTDVCKSTGIPYASFSDRESGVRTCFYEELLCLAKYYDSLWQGKYAKFNSYPVYRDDEIRDLSFTWLCLGYDENKYLYEELARIMAENYEQIERSLIAENMNLKKQVNMFENE